MRHRQSFTIGTTSCWFLLIGLSAVRGEVPAVFLDQIGRLGDSDWMIGYEFQVNHDITLTELGKFDANRNGKLDDLTAPQVGVWDSSGELVVSTSIDLSAPDERGTFFSSITPTTLSPGSYVIGVQAFDEQEPYSQVGTVSTSAAVTWTQARRASSSEFGRPETTSRREAYFGPNFKIDQAIALYGPGERSVFQRDNNGIAQVPFRAVSSGDLDRVEARAIVMDGFSGQNTGWQALETRDGVVVGAVTVPEGGWYRIETRGVRGEEVIPGDTLERIGAGEVFVTAGQSNSSNWGSPAQQPSSDLVSAMTATRSWQHAKDPQPVADGSGGSPWPALGDLLVERLGVPVGFASVGWGGTSVGQWLPGASGPDREPLYNRLQDALEQLGPNGVRAVLWHQGESDAFEQTSPDTYADRLQTVISESRKDAGYDVPWSVALASFLPSQFSTPDAQAQIVEGQRMVIEADPLVFQGPLTDDLVGRDWRWDEIHFNAAGLNEHAERWAAVITTTIVPEPMTGNLSLTGLLLVLVARRFRNRRSSSAPNR